MSDKDKTGLRPLRITKLDIKKGKVIVTLNRGANSVEQAQLRRYITNVIYRNYRDLNESFGVSTHKESPHIYFTVLEHHHHE